MLNVLLNTGLRWLWLALLVVLLDQGSKWLVVKEMALYETIELLPIFNFFHARNTGAAFSFLHDAEGWQTWLFSVIAIAVSGLLLYWLRQCRAKEVLLPVAYALIMGGAIGNVYDRITLGYVVDFIQVYYQTWYFPTFNIADSAICIGAGLLIFDALRTKKREAHG